MTTTRNKQTLNETLYSESEIKTQGIHDSEYIRIIQDDDIIVIRTDKLSHLISSLERHIANGEIVDI